MKKIIKMTLIFAALLQFGQPVFAAFDTPNGQYLSEQDLFTVLKAVFTKPGLLPENYSTITQLSYSPSQFADKNYDLGFINLESGQTMVQAPGEAYVLKIDSFINSVVNDLFYNYNDNLRKVFFSEKMNEYFLKVVQDYNQQTGVHLEFREFCMVFNFSSLPVEFQEQFVQDILRFVFLEDVLVPQSLKNNLMSSLVPILNQKQLTLQTAISVVVKKSIINDYFLKY